MGESTVLFRWPSTFVMFLWSAALLPQVKDGSCVLYTAESGDLVKVRGAAYPGGHDTFIRPVGCEQNAANRVILVWGDDRSLGTGKTEVRRNADFFRFHDLLRAAFPLPPNAFGTGQPRYRVVADFEGRLEVASAVGLKRDPKRTKVIGLEGFGHPLPFTRFRLVATSVSGIEANEQEKREP
jgi:hypothetical protein